MPFSQVPTVGHMLNIEEIHDLYNEMIFTELPMCQVLF